MICKTSRHVLSIDCTIFIRSVTVYKDKKIRQSRTLQNYAVVMPDVKHLKKVLVELDINVFSEAMKRVIISVPTSSDVGGSAGVYFNVVGKEFKLICTDGPTLTEFVGSTISEVEKESSCMLPSYFISKLSRLISKYTRGGEEGVISISLNKRVFVVRFDSLVIASSIINESFPDYLGVFIDSKKKIILKSDIFLDNIRNIIYSSDIEDDYRILVKSLGDELSLSTSSCINDGIPIIEGSSFSVEFNASILESCVRNLMCEEFCMLYAKAGEVVTIFPYKGNLKIRTAIASLK